MSDDQFILYCPSDKRLVSDRTFTTEKGANTSLRAYTKHQARREARGNRPYPAAVVATLAFYNENVRCMKTVKNLLSGKDVEIDINTPLSCDPSSETYHCM